MRGQRFAGRRNADYILNDIDFLAGALEQAVVRKAPGQGGDPAKAPKVIRQDVRELKNMLGLHRLRRAVRLGRRRVRGTVR